MGIQAFMTATFAEFLLIIIMLIRIWCMKDTKHQFNRENNPVELAFIRWMFIVNVIVQISSIFYMIWA